AGRVPLPAAGTPAGAAGLPCAGHAAAEPAGRGGRGADGRDTPLWYAFGPAGAAAFPARAGIRRRQRDGCRPRSVLGRCAAAAGRRPGPGPGSCPPGRRRGPPSCPELTAAVNRLLLWFHQLGSPPVFERFAARWAPWGFGLGLVGMAIGLYGALFVVPPDYQQGDSFRILYIHVPAAWMSLMVYALMAGYAAIALIWHIKLCEVLAMACAAIGAWFTAVTLATGSIWGKPMWGTWWDWDPRLTSELILLFLYLGVIGLNAAIEDRRAAA